MIYFFVVSISFFISYFLFHPALALSNMFGAIDHPNGRKIHSQPMARGGGFVFFVSFSLVLTIIPIDISLKIPLLLGGSVMFLIGFFDDAVNISPFVKLSGQFLALTVYHFTSELLGHKMTVFQGLLSALWMIFITNATNIVDGLNGLAGGICIAESLCLSMLALILGYNDIFFCLMILFGAILGFLPRNFPTAKIFMGDCGSLFLGFTLAALSSRLATQNGDLICIISILLIFRVPSYDTNVSFIRRLIKRKNPFNADKEHFHHLLLKHGFTKECAALLLISVSLFFGFLGICLHWLTL